MGTPSWSTKAREKNKRDSNSKGRSHIVPIWDAIIQYLKDLKGSTKNLLDLMNTFGNVAGYQIRVQN
jgi:hypothetical protein